MSRQFFAFTSPTLQGDSGRNPCLNVTSVSVARGNNEQSPMLMANEWICSNIARVLRLPVPPFALMHRRERSRKRLFASLRFGAGDSLPDDVDLDALAVHHQQICAGIVVFDIFIANDDRHRKNLKVDCPERPRQVVIFDHDRALFGCVPRRVVIRLEQLRGSLGVSTTGDGQTHCLIRRIDSTQFLLEWIERVESIPDWFIESICTEAIGLGIDQATASAGIEYLKSRRTNLGTLIHNNRAEFTMISRWGLML